MFRRGLVFQSECPDRSCTRVNCHFLHPQATKSNVPDGSSLRESSWKQLHDLKQLPSTYHDSYTPAVLHDGDDVHGVVLHHDDEAHVSPTHDADLLPLHEAVHEETTEPQHDHTVSAEQEQGVKRKWSQISAGEDETQHKRRHIEERSDGAVGAPSNASTLTSQPSSSTLTSQPSSSTHYSPSTTAPVPRPDVMGPRIASKKYTVDNFLGTTTTPLTALPVTTQNKSARQRINPSSQALSSDTCPIVSYTPNSHIDRAVRQKVVDRLYAHLKRVNPHEAVQQSLDLELEIYRSCQGRTSYTHQARVLFSELERK